MNRIKKYFVLLLFMAFSGLSVSTFAQGRSDLSLASLSNTPEQASVSAKFSKVYGIGSSKDLYKKTVVRPEYIQKLDNFLTDAIKKGVFPGVQVFATYNGNIIYQKSFGFYTYDQSPRITDSTLYDIASVTKIMATTLAVMKLYEEGKINLNYTLNDYLPEMVGNTNKRNLRIRDLLLHQAGLKAWIPFYKVTLDSATKRPLDSLYHRTASPNFSIPVAKNLFLKNTYEKEIWNEILQSPLSNSGRYVYSDLDFYFLEKVVERVSGMSLDQYVTTTFYRPMRLKNILYNPWKVGRAQECAPTEDDNYFRYQLLQGYVHDQGAAMLGGVAGHAGLFADAQSVGTILQMLLNGGRFNGVTFLKPETIRLFSAYNSNLSRRGLGFDKPVKTGKGGPTPEIVSKSSFGHQGFTGTCAWADPESGIVFVLLSNRVNPSAENWKISSMDIRTIAQEYIYKALGY